MCDSFNFTLSTSWYFETFFTFEVGLHVCTKVSFVYFSMFFTFWFQIPYPAVTVCFETKAMQTKFNYTDYYHMYLNNKDNLSISKWVTFWIKCFAIFFNDEIVLNILYFCFSQHMFEDVSMVCDDHLAPANGRNVSSGVETVDNIRSVCIIFFFFVCL